MSLKGIFGRIRQLLFAFLRHFRKSRGANSNKSNGSSQRIVLHFTIQRSETGESFSRRLAEPPLRRITDEGTPVLQDEAADDDVAGKDVPTFDIDATKWTSVIEFYRAMNNALGGPEGYVGSLDGLLDLMLWDETIEPPYTVRLFGTAGLPEDVREEIELVRDHLVRACAEFRARRGRRVTIRLETYP
jgi:hypothetical protein